MNNHSQPIYSASRHIEYDKTSKLMKLLFREKLRTCYIVSKAGKKTSPQTISIETRKFLEDCGFEVTSVTKNYLVGVKDICGIKISVDKLGGEYSGQLSIRIQGVDDSDLDSKTKTIANFIKKQCNVEPDVNTFARLGLC